MFKEFQTTGAEDETQRAKGIRFWNVKFNARGRNKTIELIPHKVLLKTLRPSGFLQEKIE